MTDQNTIYFDHQTGKVSGANFVEQLGLGLFRLGAILGVPLNFNGYSIGAKMVRSVLPSAKTVIVDYGDGFRFAFPYGDAYWSILLNNRHVYSPEIEVYFEQFKGEEYLFIDCGANYGYMSSFVSSEKCGGQRCIAIEADASSFAWTRRNAELNENRFECRHNAIFSKSGDQVAIHGEKHEARSILPEMGVARDGLVTTLSVGDLATEVGLDANAPVLLKLDVEGVEIDALAGCRDWLDGPWLIAFEEHGGDKDHKVARHIMNDLGMDLWFGGSKGDRLEKIESEERLGTLKSNARIGYDFFATRSDFWNRKLQSIMEAQQSAR